MAYENNEKYTEVDICESVGFIDAEIYCWERVYIPTYIPTGYSFYEEAVFGSYVTIMYYLLIY